MNDSLWPKGKTSAATFTFDLDGDIIWQNMSSDEPNTESLIRARSIGQYGPNRCVDMILDLLDKYGVKATFFVPGYVAEHNPEVIRHTIVRLLPLPWVCQTMPPLFLSVKRCCARLMA